MGTHYSPSQDPERLHSFAVSAATEIEVMLEGNTPVVLCYSGMSGIGMATALMMELHHRKRKVGMIYVRKANESSHGGRVEADNVCTDTMKDAVFIFVDDFISLGGTIRRVQQGIYDNWCRLGKAASSRQLDYVLTSDTILKKPEPRLLEGCKPQPIELKTPITKEVKPKRVVKKSPAYPVNPKAVLKLKNKR